MVDRIVIWDDRNTYHLLIERAHRHITQDHVETVLLDPDTATVQRPSGHDFYIGRIPPDRVLAVIAMGEREIYPLTAYWVPRARWRKAHDQAHR